MALEANIDISLPPMERDAKPEADNKEKKEGETQDESQATEEETPHEPTEEELKQMELKERAIQLHDEITELKLKLQEKEKELAEVKEQLGITPLVEFKESLSQGWKVLGEKWSEMKESDRYKKADSTVTGWKQKISESESYQKTKETLSGWGGKASDAVKKTGSAIKENETLQNIGQRMRTATTKLKDTWNRTMSTDEEAATEQDNEGEKGVTEEPVEPKAEEDVDKPAEKND